MSRQLSVRWSSEKEVVIHEVEDGWVLRGPWPVGGKPVDEGEIFCQDWEEVVNILHRIKEADDE